MDIDEPTPTVYTLPIPRAPGPPPPAEPYALHRDAHTPLVLDNGSTTLRWGFASSAAPFTGLNAVAKYKERRTNKPLLLFGEAIDAESGAKSQTRTPWEGDVLLNFDALENALDYAFVYLGIDTPTVDHPVIMSERICTPLHSRALTSELMFELYNVPSLTYCVDGVMSFYANHLPPPTTPFTSDGLVLSFNTHSTSVIPILKGKGIMSHVQRIPWGAAQSSEYLLKLIQLKYPSFPTRVTSAQTNWMYRTFCSFTPSYPTLLKSLSNPATLRSHERILQFPFLLPQTDEKSPSELARLAEKRKEQGKKLQELAAKSRADKLLQKEADLEYLLDLRGESELTGKMSRKEWAARLSAEGFESEAALEDTIKKLDVYVKKARKKEAGEVDEPMEEPSFPLVDVPDEELDEEGLKEKKKQKLLKSGWEFRVRARKEKEREREEREREAKREEEERETDLAGWSSKMRKEQETLMGKIKDRARRKTALTDRKSAAAQARMKNIANLAADDRVPKKKRKGGGEDMFGADDADWQIYRKINITAPSDDEEDDLTSLHEIERKLLTYDPTFTPSHTHASLTSLSSALLTSFRPPYPDTDPAGHARIHLSTERFRVPETYFSPSMAGTDTAGLGEVIANVLARFPEHEKASLVKNVFLTGAPSQVGGLREKLEDTLRPILDPEMPMGIVQAADAGLDAWRGMAAYARTPEFGVHGVSRAEYEEWGGERVKRWWGGNRTGSS
ncbi:chromatin remodeling complex subunit [Ephemerocybe angulata]|uniref:Chromatin remodeling complex subunit n=1 Tax=Ephemerocybe angulata TaxID=980116 RepID=A0A8H6HRY2_9AGAR|nr:chromatin remodeling complex subunit [Tulosesus angulatus]